MASFRVEVKGIEAAKKKLGAEADKFLREADRKFKVAGTRMEFYAKSSAPVDTGFHRRSIRHVPNSPFLSTILIAAAKYASVLEFGFFGFVSVSAHTRVITQAFGRPLSGPVQVQVDSHIRPMSRPARPHIRPAAERALEQLITDLQGIQI